jgi:hypothetical protein
MAWQLSTGTTLGLSEIYVHIGCCSAKEWHPAHLTLILHAHVMFPMYHVYQNASLHNKVQLRAETIERGLCVGLIEAIRVSQVDEEIFLSRPAQPAVTCYVFQTSRAQYSLIAKFYLMQFRTYKAPRCQHTMCPNTVSNFVLNWTYLTSITSEYSVCFPSCLYLSNDAASGSRRLSSNDRMNGE